jgi:hypothetical protein
MLLAAEEAPSGALTTGEAPVAGAVHVVPLTGKAADMVKKCDADMTKAKAEYDAKTTKSRTDLLIGLQSILEKLKATDPQADLIKAKIEELESESGTESASGGNDILIGTWQMQGKYNAIWIFSRNGTVQSTGAVPRGIWRKEADGILIAWQWDMLKLPLDPRGTKQSSWLDGENSGIVRKIK